MGTKKKWTKICLALIMASVFQYAIFLPKEVTANKVSGNAYNWESTDTIVDSAGVNYERISCTDKTESDQCKELVPWLTYAKPSSRFYISNEQVAWSYTDADGNKTANVVAVIEVYGTDFSTGRISAIQSKSQTGSGWQKQNISIGNLSAGPVEEIALDKVVINGLIQMITRDGIGKPINETIVCGATCNGDDGIELKLVLYDQNGHSLNLNGAEAGNDSRNIIDNKNTPGDGYYSWNQMTVADTMYTNRVYSLRANTAKDHLVDCTTGADTSLTDGVCTLSYGGRVDFEITADKKIKVVSDATSWEKAATGANLDGGMRLNITEYLNSPLDKALSTAIKTMGSLVETGLKWVMPQIKSLLNSTTTWVLGVKGSEDTTGMTKPWLAIRNLSMILLVMALLIIAFANTLQIDIEKYGLNRMIPKIIISIIMALASWIIVEFFFDLSSAIQGQAFGLLGGADGLSTLGSVTITSPAASDIVGKIGAILALLVIFFGVLICGVILLFSLLIRVLVLSILLVVAPIAFILNITPFTESMYKQWWSMFFKWMFMGPMAVMIIAIGGLIATAGGSGFGQASVYGTESLTQTGATGSGMSLMIGVLIFGASLYIAATFPLKWGEGIMKGWGSFGKKLASPLTNTAKKAGKAAGAGLWNSTGGRITQPIGSAVKQWRGDKKDERTQKNDNLANRMLFSATGRSSGMSPEVFTRNQESATLNEIAKKHQYLDRDSFEEAYKNAKSPLSRKAILLAGTRAGLLNDKMKSNLVDSVGSDHTGLLEAAAQKDYISDIMKSDNDLVKLRSAWSIAKNPNAAKAGDLAKLPGILEDTANYKTGDKDKDKELGDLRDKISSKISGLSEQQYREMEKSKSTEEIEQIKETQKIIDYRADPDKIQDQASIANELLGNSRRLEDIQAASELAKDEQNKNK